MLSRVSGGLGSAMNEDEDLMVALRLQEEWDARAAKRAAQETLSLVDASWELVDPTPDLQGLFVQFNDNFFWGRLEAVEVKWSARMTLCAGICCYEGSGGMCSIRTLLHEMIHAYLFITNNDKDREGHGPEFCKHMHRINRLTGANITVYHTFHDEVEEYRRHWWRCNGPCQYTQPYYGYVKRATNRAPSAHDYWWAEHQKTCGGTYIKIKEPENYSKKGKGKAKLQKQPISTVENKDKPSRSEAQPLIPFSGKGYVLEEVRNPPSSGKSIAARAINESQDLFSQDNSAVVRHDSTTEVKFKQNSSSKKFHIIPPVHQSVLSTYFPRVSVANQKAFRSVTGSLLKNGTVGDITKHSVYSSSQRKVPSSKTSLRNPSKVMASASVTSSPYGHGSKDKFPGKRPRLEDSTIFDTFFMKKEQLQSDSSEPESSSHFTATTQSSSSLCSQSQLVSCPVCQTYVVESQINEHLDQCLEGSALRDRS
ncbi:sprT-like domain-containing protein Spartan isoform X2 [Fukomys damarensis]|uniref:sprT-like domain-containing protein Spartan isoform X2 n=1 Tax=Fukomys damarensis TaxID=885580 RepID=UPI00053F2FBA|nr:sprT-like domain-containing protein Spartan isoform X2 [Fukomys damarensis]